MIKAIALVAAPTFGYILVCLLVQAIARG